MKSEVRIYSRPGSVILNLRLSPNYSIIDKGRTHLNDKSRSKDSVAYTMNDLIT
jgi:hypothetical protein